MAKKSLGKGLKAWIAKHGGASKAGKLAASKKRKKRSRK